MHDRAEPAAPAGDRDPGGVVAGSRSALVAADLVARLPPGSPWQIRTVAETASTNADLAALAAAGADSGQVLIAEFQAAGRGRRGRTWTAPPGSGLTMSVMLTVPEVPLARRSWIGTIGGLSVRRAICRVAGVDARLKWPNDVLIAGAKCAGLLAETAGDAVILGMGLNVSQRREELPRPDATSLLLSGALRLDRAALAAEILTAAADWVDRWRDAAGDPRRSGLLDAARRASATLGETVRLQLPGGGSVTGVAVDLTEDGAVVVDTVAGRRTFAAGDVEHLRAASVARPTVEA